MTNTPKDWLASRAGRHALRLTGAASQTPADSDDLVAALPVDAQHPTPAMRSALTHTSTAWNSLRHAC